MPDQSAQSTHALSAAERIRAEQVRLAYGAAPWALTAMFIFALLLTALLWSLGSAPRPRLGVWLALVAADFVVRQWLGWGYRHDGEAHRRGRIWGLRFTVATLVGGLVWGAGAVWLLSPLPPTQALLVLLVTLAAAAGAVVAFGSCLAITCAYVIPAIGPFGAWAWFHDDALHLAAVGVAAVILLTLLALAWRANVARLEGLRLRFQYRDRAETLRHDKVALEQAGSEQTRFLAAASDELRQPVRGLGALAGALKGHVTDDDGRRLLSQLDGSVHGLEALLAALQYSAHFDAGLFAPRMQPFPLQPLLERVCAERRAEAEAKGLHLLLRPCPAVVNGDPVLLEHLLRNLLANAIQRTGHGGVVVSCRLGTPLRLQVWDTGGTDGEGSSPGLTMVQRLAALMASPLTARTVAGRGSVCELSLPLVSRATAPAVASTREAAPAQGGGLVLVVDADTETRESLGAQLDSWGYQTITAISGERILERLAGRDQTPRLIICADQLPDAEGAAVIQRLQLEYEQPVPALLLCEATDPERLAAARRSGFVLLQKPVPSGALRAAIDNLLRAAVPVGG